MNEPTQVLVQAAADALRPTGIALQENGWRAELVVYAPGELEMGGRVNDGYAVALVLVLPLPPLACGEAVIG